MTSAANTRASSQAHGCRDAALLPVDLSNDKLRKLINPAPVPGWVGGVAQSTPDISTLPILKNRTNIDELQRQQKVVWPEFSWNTEPDAELRSPPSLRRAASLRLECHSIFVNARCC